MTTKVNGNRPDHDDWSTPTPAEVCRRLHHARLLVHAATVCGQEEDQHESLRRARGHLSGTLRKLDELIAQVTSPTPRPVDDEVTRPRRVPPGNR